jgi:hypothetical protein
MKAYWGVEVYLYAFLTSALDGGEWSASRPGSFTHRERAPGTHWIGGWGSSKIRFEIDENSAHVHDAPLWCGAPPPKTAASGHPSMSLRRLDAASHNVTACLPVTDAVTSNPNQKIKFCCYVTQSLLVNIQGWNCNGKHTRTYPVFCTDSKATSYFLNDWGSVPGGCR